MTTGKPGVTIIGLEDLRRKLSSAEMPGPAMSTLLTDASAHGKKVAAEGVGGTVARSIVSEVRPMSARVRSMMSDARSTSIELGRKPGGPLLHPDALKRWIKRVGYAGSPFTLARMIQRRGVKGRFFMRAAIRSTEAILPSLMRNAAREIETRFGR